MARERNRFIAVCNQNRPQTWHIKDRDTDKIVDNHLTGWAAKEQAARMNAEALCGRPIYVSNGRILETINAAKEA